MTNATLTDQKQAAVDTYMEVMLASIDILEEYLTEAKSKEERQGIIKTWRVWGARTRDGLCKTLRDMGIEVDLVPLELREVERV